MQRTNQPDFVSERGQAMMEFAFSLVLLLILLAGAFDVGRAFFTHTVLRSAAGDAATLASACRLDQDYLNDLVRTSFYSNGLTLDDAAVTVDCDYWRYYDSDGDGYRDGDPEYLGACADITPVVGADVVVATVTYPNFRLAMPFLGTFLGTQDIELRAVSAEVDVNEHQTDCPVPPPAP